MKREQITENREQKGDKRRQSAKTAILCSLLSVISLGAEGAKLCRIQVANTTVDQTAGTWSFTNANITVSGVYRCVNNLPNAYASRSDANIFGAPNQGGNMCMCKRLSPSVSDWFLGAATPGNWGNVGGCEPNCIDYCVRQQTLILN